MKNVMTNEAPSRVMPLLGVALSTLAFLFAVSVSNASFSGVENKIADPFATDKIVALVDSVASSYSGFVTEYAINPARQDYAEASLTIQWAASNAKDGAVAMLGIQPSQPHVAMVPQGKVAGATTDTTTSAVQKTSGLLDVLYATLIR